MNILKPLREKQNLTQRQVAKKLHLAESSISLFESGKRKPPLKIIKPYAKILKVSVEEILDCFCGE